MNLLSELKNTDIKNINIAKLRSDLLKRRDVLINCAVVFLTIFIIFKFFSAQLAQAQNLKTQASQMETKIAAIAKHDQALKELNALIESLPEGIPESALIDKVTDFAEKSNIHIVTFSPTQTEDNELYKHSRISLQISADQYKDFLNFIQDIESSGLNLRVDQWSGSFESDSQFAQSSDKRSGKEGSHKTFLNISAVYFFKKI